ncbi:chp3 [Apiospora marii]|uniref:chp3 n=1 Tax=Apiospora marii TaxID=335849 RepID=UPI0031320D38
MVAIAATGPPEVVPDRGSALMTLTWVLTALAFVTVALRISFRAKVKKFGWDDLFMVLSMLCFFGWSIALTLYAFRGGTRHIWHVALLGDDNMAAVQLLNWTSQVFGIMGVAAGKISVSALLLAIIRQTEMRWQRMYIWVITITLASVVALSCSILTFAQCSPPRRLWDQRVDGHCIDPLVMSGFGTFTGSFNTFADASLAIIPITIFWSLQNKTAERIQLSIVFSLNILTSICSGIKTQYLAELANRDDLTWATFEIFAWVTAELFLMIVCGTIPTLYPLLRGMRLVVLRLSSKWSASRSDPDPKPDPQFRDPMVLELVTIGGKGYQRPEVNISQKTLLPG